MGNNKVKGQEGGNASGNKFPVIMGLFVLVVLCVQPLVFHDFYFDILETKYQFYCGTAITMIVVMALYGLWSGAMIEFFKKTNVKSLIKSLSVVDWMMLAYWFAHVLSWIFCFDWPWEAFWGTSGRFNGVFLLSIYMVVYFLVTRFFEFKKWYLDAFLAVGLLVCLFGITDYFQMDLLGFKRQMVPHQRNIYTSTFGNINTYTVYVAAVMVVSTILFAAEKCPKKMVWYYVNMVVACFALIMGCSDNAYLSLAVLFGLAPLYLLRTKTGTSRYLISVATFFTVILCIDKINALYAETVIGIDSAFKIIAGMSILPVIVVALWILAGGVTALLRKAGKNDSEEMNLWVVRAWFGIVVLVVCAVAFAFYDATVLGNSNRYGALASYVTFNDKWGTSRGYVWVRALEIWRDELNPLQKIFGYGADTFALLMRMYDKPHLQGGSYVVFDSVHNEYLQYLVTIGVFGVVSYIGFLVTAVRAMSKNVKNHPEVAAVMFVVIAYAVQALININLPVVTPIILQLLFMGLSKTTEEDQKLR